MQALHFLSPKIGWLSLDTTAGGASRLAIYGTRDGGQHWNLLHLWSPANPPPWAQGAQWAGITGPFRLAFTSPADGWGVVNLGVGACQASYGILHTTDGGRHWQVAASNLLGSDGPVALAFSTKTTGWLTNGSCASAQTALMGTSDGGKNWHLVKSFSAASPDAGAAATVMRFTSPTRGFIVNAYVSPVAQVVPQFQALVTRDGGKTWQPTPLAAGTLRGMVAGMSFVSPSQGWVLLRRGSQAVLEATADGGQHWRLIPGPRPGGLFGWPLADLVTPKVGYVAGASDASGSGTQLVWKTTDGGATWHLLSLPVPPSPSVAATMTFPANIPTGDRLVKIAWEDAVPSLAMIGYFPSSVTYGKPGDSRTSGMTGFLIDPSRHTWWFGYSPAMFGTSGHLVLEFQNRQGGIVTATSPLLNIPNTPSGGFLQLPVAEDASGYVRLPGFTFRSSRDGAWTSAPPTVTLDNAPGGAPPPTVTMQNIPLEWKLQSLSWQSPAGSLSDTIGQIGNPAASLAPGFSLMGSSGAIGFTYPPAWAGHSGRVVATFTAPAGQTQKVASSTVTLK